MGGVFRPETVTAILRAENSPLRPSEGLFASMKKLTDTDRYSAEWYQTLPPEMKCAYDYIWAHCDHAGVWVENRGLADHIIGKKVDWEEFATRTAEHVICFQKKWILIGYVEAQFGQLNPESRVHKAVITSLRKHSMFDEDSLSIAYPRKSDSLSDSLSETPDRLVVYSHSHSPSQEGVQGEGKKLKRGFRKAESEAEVIEFFAAELRLTESDAQAWWNQHQANGWTTNKKPILDWKAKARQWFHSGYHPSQKGQPGKSTAEPEIQYWEPPDAENLESFADSVKRRAAEVGFTFDDKAEAEEVRR